MAKEEERRSVRDIAWRSWARWCEVVSLVALSRRMLMIGNGSGIVVGTGKNTEFGVIFSMMQDVSFVSGLQLIPGRGEENSIAIIHG